MKGCIIALVVSLLSLVDLVITLDYALLGPFREVNRFVLWLVELFGIDGYIVAKVVVGLVWFCVVCWMSRREKYLGFWGGMVVFVGCFYVLLTIYQMSGVIVFGDG